LGSSPDADAGEYPKPPHELFDDLFVTVQTEHIFKDSKELCDAIPKSAPADILERFHREGPWNERKLKAFVQSNFVLPLETAPTPISSESVPIRSHIKSLWGALTRSAARTAPYSSLLPVPRPFVVPGGRFREVYYWDTYFSMLGLMEDGRRDLAEDMVADFAYLIDTYGHIPNGNRSYYLSRSQPPFFFMMVALLDPEDPATTLAQYLPQLKMEYTFWMRGAEGLRPGSVSHRVVALANGSLLNRYWDDEDTPRDEAYSEDMAAAKVAQREPQGFYRDIRAAAESGWDFSSRWFADSRRMATIDTTEIVPIDLNSLLFGLERAILAGCERTGDRECAREFATRSSARRAAIDQFLWDETSGVYVDYSWTHAQRIVRVTGATLYPLFLGISTDGQASSVAKVVEKRLLKRGGLVTTPIDTGQQWDSPNGWAPLQWIAVAGLNRYGQMRLAERIACRWMVNVSRVYNQTGKLLEKYDVIASDRPGGGGEYPLQDGFGWTNGVMLKLMSLYPADAAKTKPDQCAGIYE
jgi:alpha,alpha-trehalase